VSPLQGSEIVILVLREVGATVYSVLGFIGSSLVSTVAGRLTARIK
jgi:hypothetical protein